MQQALFAVQLELTRDVQEQRSLRRRGRPDAGQDGLRIEGIGSSTTVAAGVPVSALGGTAASAGSTELASTRRPLPTGAAAISSAVPGAAESPPVITTPSTVADSTDCPCPKASSRVRGRVELHAVAADERSGAVFKGGTCDRNGPWTGTGPLKPAGVWVRDRTRTPDDFPTG